MDDERAITYVADDVMQAGLATTQEYTLAGVFVCDVHPCRSFPGDALAR